MPSTDVLLAFTAMALIMNLSPGPSNLYVMARSIAQGAKGGIVATMGLAVGSMVHVLATAFGLSALFHHSPALYTIIKLIGAAYLIYLGVRYWQSGSADTSESAVKTKEKTFSSVFMESIIVEVTNPKTALFFLALLPQFVVPEAGLVSHQLLLLGLIVTLSAIPCDLLVALGFSQLSHWLIKHKRAQRIQEQVSGSVLLSMGTYLVVDEIRATH